MKDERQLEFLPASPPIVETSDRITAKQLVTRFVDHMQAHHGRRPPTNVLKRVGTEAGKLIKEKELSNAELERGVEILAERGMDPSMLPSAVFSAQAEPRRSLEARDRELMDDFINTRGWPTGARFVRGSHAGTYVYHPLGTDRLPPGYNDPSIHKPSRAEILDALRKEADGLGSDTSTAR